MRLTRTSTVDRLLTLLLLHHGARPPRLGKGCEIIASPYCIAPSIISRLSLFVFGLAVFRISIERWRVKKRELPVNSLLYMEDVERKEGIGGGGVPGGITVEILQGNMNSVISCAIQSREVESPDVRP